MARIFTVPSWSRDLPDSKADGGKAAHLICSTKRALLVEYEFSSPGQHYRGMEPYLQLRLYRAEPLCFLSVNLTSCQCAWRCHIMCCRWTLTVNRQMWSIKLNIPYFMQGLKAFQAAEGVVPDIVSVATNYWDIAAL